MECWIDTLYLQAFTNLQLDIKSHLYDDISSSQQHISILAQSIAMLQHYYAVMQLSSSRDFFDESLDIKRYDNSLLKFVDAFLYKNRKEYLRGSYRLHFIQRSVLLMRFFLLQLPQDKERMRTQLYALESATSHEFASLLLLADAFPEELIECKARDVLDKNKDKIRNFHTIGHYMFKDPFVRERLWVPFVVKHYAMLSSYFGRALRDHTNPYESVYKSVAEIPWESICLDHLEHIVAYYKDRHSSGSPLLDGFLMPRWLHMDPAELMGTPFYLTFGSQMNEYVHKELSKYFETPQPHAPAAKLIQLVKLFEHTWQLLIIDVTSDTAMYMSKPASDDEMVTYYCKDQFHRHFA